MAKTWLLTRGTALDAGQPLAASAQAWVGDVIPVGEWGGTFFAAVAPTTGTAASSTMEKAIRLAPVPPLPRRFGADYAPSNPGILG